MQEEGIQDFLMQQLQTDIKLSNAKKVGKGTFVIDVENMEDKRNILMNKLKCRKYKDEIYINNDFTKKDDRFRSRLEEELGRTKIKEIELKLDIINYL